VIRPALFALLLAAGSALAPCVTELYPKEVLTGDQARFQERLAQIYQRGLWDFLDGQRSRRWPTWSCVFRDLAAPRGRGRQFALDLLARSNTIPMGAALWFQATTGFFPNRADFETDAAFFDWQQRQATHPVNPQRLQRLALALERAASDSLDPAHAEVLRFIATRLVTIADTLAEPDMQRLIARRAVFGDSEDLKRR
jgi:hypothetical protein